MIIACSRASRQCDLMDVTTFSWIFGKHASGSSRAGAVSHWTCIFSRLMPTIVANAA
jgi:hypothetical protein